jgi:hypothetical protein
MEYPIGDSTCGKDIVIKLSIELTILMIIIKRLKMDAFKKHN